MRRIFYILSLITMIGVISCHGLLDEPPPVLSEVSQQKNHNRITIEKAAAAFDRNQSYFAQATRGDSHAEGSALMPGMYSVDWSSSIWSGNGSAEALESSIAASRHFIACDGDVTVDVRQRLLTIMSSRDTAYRQYIATIIPTPAFFVAHPLDFADRFVQCQDDHGLFSGTVLYHTLDGVFCEIARFDDGQIELLYNAVEDYRIGDYQNVVSSVDFVFGDFHLHENPNSVTRCEEIACEYEGCIEAVSIIVCAHCGKRLGALWQTCMCKIDFEPGRYDLTTVNHTDKWIAGGAGNGDIEIKDIEKRPCYDKVTGKANPLKKMELAPPAGSKPSAGVFGSTRQKGTKFHQGIDFLAPVGTNVYAVRSGRITRLIDHQVDRVWNGQDWVYPNSYGKGLDRNGAGNRITITTSNDGGADSYWHLQSGNTVAINPRTGNPFKHGDWVEAGDHIGYTGRSGNGHSAPHHLHFGTQEVDGAWANPENIINANVMIYADGNYYVTTPCD